MQSKVAEQHASEHCEEPELMPRGAGVWVDALLADHDELRLEDARVAPRVGAGREHDEQVRHALADEERARVEPELGHGDRAAHRGTRNEPSKEAHEESPVACAEPRVDGAIARRDQPDEEQQRREASDREGIRRGEEGVEGGVRREGAHEAVARRVRVEGPRPVPQMEEGDDEHHPWQRPARASRGRAGPGRAGGFDARWLGGRCGRAGGFGGARWLGARRSTPGAASARRREDANPEHKEDRPQHRKDPRDDVLSVLSVAQLVGARRLVREPNGDRWGGAESLSAVGAVCSELARVELGARAAIVAHAVSKPTAVAVVRHGLAALGALTTVRQVSSVSTRGELGARAAVVAVRVASPEAEVVAVTPRA